MWEEMLFKGILYISVKHCFFYSEAEQKSVIIQMQEIGIVDQQRAGVFPNSLQISTIKGEKVFLHFILFYIL